MKLAIIGAGNVGKALISRLSKHKLLVSSGHGGKYEGISIVSDNLEVASESEVILLAVKPAQMPGVLEEIKEGAKGKLVLTFAAGLPLSFYKKHLTARIVRVMPTVAIKYGKGFSGYFLDKNCTKEDEKLVQQLLAHLGTSLKLEQEALLDVITGVSGSGIAYFLKIMDSFINIAVQNGFRQEEATKIILETVKGAVALAEQQSPSEAIKTIVSKGGTTEQGLKQLEKNNIDRILQQTIQATIDKCKELAK